MQTNENFLMPELTLREGEDGDSNFILNSWMLSYKGTKTGSREERAASAGGAELAGRAMDPQRYFRGQQALIGALAERRRVLVVCDVNDPAFVVGWACGELVAPPEGPKEVVVDYVYVKHAYRKHGVARELLKALGWEPGIPIIATHWTKPCNQKAVKYQLTFDDSPISLGAA